MLGLLCEILQVVAGTRVHNILADKGESILLKKIV